MKVIKSINLAVLSIDQQKMTEVLREMGIPYVIQYPYSDYTDFIVDDLTKEQWEELRNKGLEIS